MGTPSPSPWLRSLIEAAARRAQPVRHGAIGADGVGDEEGEDDLHPVDRRRREESVTLIDQVQNCANDQGDQERTARNTVRHCAAACRLPIRHLSISLSTASLPTAYRSRGQ